MDTIGLDLSTPARQRGRLQHVQHCKAFKNVFYFILKVQLYEDMECLQNVQFKYCNSMMVLLLWLW